MSHHIAVFGTEKDKTFLLKKDVDNYVEIFAFGALINQFVIDGQNVIDGFANPKDAQMHLTDHFQSAKLSPFPCRLANSAFSF